MTNEQLSFLAFWWSKSKDAFPRHVVCPLCGYTTQMPRGILWWGLGSLVIGSSLIYKRCKEYRDADKAQRIGSERPRSTVLIGWKPLIDGWVKLNIDGACKGRIIVGCGGIFRNNREDWLGRVEICVEYEI
ncbi:unnamed protein product [Trifolium pratense]|uniref:Uncharacterized protein n=1 Tax=Trifolium pratense TaxID=57577 RepID=A0ACB0L3Z4_TRIPR|nr:unnamed protein product [Trifolium pratense]